MWSADQKRMFARDIWEGSFERGRGLKFLSPSLREAIVDARILGIVRTQHAETVSVDAMDDLYEGVHAEMRRLLAKAGVES